MKILTRLLVVWISAFPLLSLAEHSLEPVSRIDTYLQAGIKEGFSGAVLVAQGD